MSKGRFVGSEQNDAQDIFVKDFRQHSFPKGKLRKLEWKRRSTKTGRSVGQSFGFRSAEALLYLMAKALQRLKVARPPAPQD
jgi:hypothetical protein